MSVSDTGSPDDMGGDAGVEDPDAAMPSARVTITSPGHDELLSGTTASVDINYEIDAMQREGTTLELSSDGRSLASQDLAADRGVVTFSNVELLTDATSSAAVTLSARLVGPDGPVASHTRRVYVDARTAYVEALEAASEVDVDVSYDGRGRLTSVRAKVAVDGESPAERARDFLREHGALFGIEGAEELRVGDVRTSDESSRRRSVSFLQIHEGLKVLGAHATVLVRGDHVELAHVRWASELPDEVDVGLSYLEAVAVARQSLSGSFDTPRGRPRLVWFDEGVTLAPEDRPAEPRPAEPAWRFRLEGTRADGLPDVMEVIVGARSERVIRAWTTIEESETQLFTYDLNSSNFPSCDDYITTHFDDLACTSALGCVTGTEQVTRTVHEGMGHVVGMFRDRFGHDGYSPGNRRVVTFARHGRATVSDNLAGQYLGGCDVIRLIGDRRSYSLIGHEYTHGIIDHTARLEYIDSSGATNEGFAQIFGYMARGDHTGSYCRLVCERPDVVRPAHMDGYCATEQGCPENHGRVHTNRYILQYVGELLMHGGDHPDIPEVTLSGIGPDRTGHLFYDVLVEDLGRWSGLRETGDALYKRALFYASNGIHGFDRDALCQVSFALFSVGLRESPLATGWGCLIFAELDGDVGFDFDEDGIFDDGIFDEDGTFIPGDSCPTSPPDDEDRGHVDTDGDGDVDACDLDDDGDGVSDQLDNCPKLYGVSLFDTDGDGLGDACDEDDDGDGVADTEDPCPLHFAEPSPLFCSDRDGDGISDHYDLCAGTPLPEGADSHRDRDGDRIGDLCDSDIDGDGVENDFDLCPEIAATLDGGHQDSDGDGYGDECDGCPGQVDADAEDIDHDGLWSACDPDDDADGVDDDQDNCPETPNPTQIDGDGDGLGRACDLQEREDYFEERSIPSIISIPQSLEPELGVDLPLCGPTGCQAQLDAPALAPWVIQVTIPGGAPLVPVVYDSYGDIAAWLEPAGPAPPSGEYSTWIGRLTPEPAYLALAGLDGPLFSAPVYTLQFMSTTSSTPADLPTTATLQMALPDDATACNNGTLEAGEVCEGSDLRGASCTSMGYTAGELSCAADCTLDVSACTECGNDVTEDGETCDGSDVGATTCQDFDYPGGALSCDATCGGFDTSGCTPCVTQNDCKDVFGNSCRSTGKCGTCRGEMDCYDPYTCVGDQCIILN